VDPCHRSIDVQTGGHTMNCVVSLLDHCGETAHSVPHIIMPVTSARPHETEKLTQVASLYVKGTKRGDRHGELVSIVIFIPIKPQSEPF
jgi:hypothetical protein